MNNKVVIGIVIAAIVVGAGFFLVYNKRSYSSPPQVSPSNEATQEQNAITLTESGFSPSTLTVKAGTKVTWINKSGGQATVNSSSHPIHTSYPPLNLGSFLEGSTLSLVFAKPGTYGYHNHLNSSQTGTIIVQ